MSQAQWCDLTIATYIATHTICLIMCVSAQSREIVLFYSISLIYPQCAH